MRELDKNTSYDLRDLNESQLKEFKQECIKQGATNVFYKDSVDDFNEYIKMNNFQLSETLFNGKWRLSKGLDQSVNALTLFEPQLKIGDTFEKDGFVCRVESDVEKWVYDNTRTDKYVRTKHYRRHLNEVTNKEFIAQLEKYSK